MWDELPRKNHHTDPCSLIPLIPAFQASPTSCPQTSHNPKPLKKKLNDSIFHWNNREGHIYLLPRLEQLLKFSLPSSPCQSCLNYFEIPSGRNHYHKYLRFQFIKRQRKKTHIHPTYDLTNLWEMGLSRRAFLNAPQNTLAGSFSFLPQQYSNLSA